LSTARYSFPVVSAAALLVAGCAIPEPPSSEDALAEVLGDQAAVPDNYSAATSPEVGELPANWVDSFGDPQLSAIVEEGLVHNLNLRGAAAQLEAASGFVVQAGSQMKPHVAAAGESTDMNYSSGAGNTSSQAALQVSWELDVWGRVRAETAAAQAGYEAATADYEFARLSLKAQLAKTWFVAVETQQQLAFARTVVALNEETLRVVSAKHEFGEVSMSDVHLARSDLAASQERVQQVEGALSTARRALEVLLGRYPSAEIEIAEGFVAVPPTIPVGLPSELLERRPDLVAADRRVASAFNQVTAAKAARLPSIGLTGAGGAVDNELNDMLGLGSGFFSVGANFLGPIYSGGALKAQVEIETAEQEAALAGYGQKALTAFSEVENALTNEGLLKRREELLEQVVADNQAALDLAQIQYQEGDVELLNVLVMQARLVNTEVQLINLRNLRLAERINLHLAIGGDFAAPAPPSPPALPAAPAEDS
jgi:NodT family efflux transporter outer membrane factor (OMF) lipoprotein